MRAALMLSVVLAGCGPALPGLDSGTAEARDAGFDAGVAAPDAGADAGTDAGADAGADAGLASDDGGLVELFVALGNGARTVISCDDGESWVEERSLDSNDADHAPNTARGIAYGNGVFVAAVGWGYPGRLRVSGDGVNWAEAATASSGFSGVVFGDAGFLAVEQGRAVGSTDGRMWGVRGDLGSGPIVRTLSWGGGRYVAAGDPVRLSYSASGSVWQAPASLGGCTGGAGRRGGLVFGAGVHLSIMGDGSLCRSTDGAASWTLGSLGAGRAVAGYAMWSGTDFYVAADDRAHKSLDGVTWTTHVFNLTGTQIRTVARGKSGTWVGLGHDGASFFRSADGINWTRLAASAAPSGTSLLFIATGAGRRSPSCR